MGARAERGTCVNRPVAVVNAPPVYGLGLIQALSTRSVQICDVTNVVQWARTAGACGVLCAVYDKPDLDVVVDLSDSAPDAVVVTLVPTLSAAVIRECLRAGAQGSVPFDAEPVDVVFALTAAMNEKTVLPTDVAQELAKHAVTLQPQRELSERDGDWLRRLARGDTVAELAQSADYSTREMFRLLANLYGRMGVRHRTEALITAAHWGVL